MLGINIAPETDGTHLGGLENKMWMDFAGKAQSRVIVQINAPALLLESRLSVKHGEIG